MHCRSRACSRVTAGCSREWVTLERFRKECHHRPRSGIARTAPGTPRSRPRCKSRSTGQRPKWATDHRTGAWWHWPVTPRALVRSVSQNVAMQSLWSDSRPNHGGWNQAERRFEPRVCKMRAPVRPNVVGRASSQGASLPFRADSC